MIGPTGFTILVYAIWLSAAGFGALVGYWFVRQGFSEAGVASGTDFELESRSYTRTSLLIWAGFFVVLLALILLAG